MARRFSVQRGATRVIFGEGAVNELAAEVERLGVRRAIGAGIVAIAREHAPIDVVNAARRELEKSGADAVAA